MTEAIKSHMEPGAFLGQEVAGKVGHLDLTFFKFVLDSLPIAVVALDPDLKITGFNPWAEKLMGYTASEAIGHNCGEILQGGKCGLNCPLKTVLNRVKPLIRLRTTVRNRKGEVIPVGISTSGLFDKQGKLIGAVEAFQDISHLIALEREKANLMSMFAHDMRSSLSGIHGLGLRLLRKPADMNIEKEKKHLEIIIREASKLESLVDDFLEFSCLETGKLKLNFSATSLDRELEELFEVYKAKASEHGINLELQTAEILPAIEADARRLRRVFTNLLDNALKFSKKHGTVAIVAQETDQEIMVKIVDDGIGIASEDLPFIFDLFHRGSRVGKKEGFGLGLATVKAIVEGHGGRIIASSQLDQGATFTVFLPKRMRPEENQGVEIEKYGETEGSFD